jgi:hypothetical protein
MKCFCTDLQIETRRHTSLQQHRGKHMCENGVFRQTEISQQLRIGERVKTSDIVFALL